MSKVSMRRWSSLFPKFAQFLMVVLGFHLSAGLSVAHAQEAKAEQAPAAAPAPAIEAAKPAFANTRRVLERLRVLLDSPVTDLDGKVTRKSYADEKAERDTQEDLIAAVKAATEKQDEERGRLARDEARRRETVKAAGERVNPRWFDERKLNELFAKLAETKKFISDQMAGKVLELRKSGEIKPVDIMDEKQYSALAETNDLLVDLLGGKKSPYADRDKQVEGLLNSCPTPEAMAELKTHLDTVEKAWTTAQRLLATAQIARDQALGRIRVLLAAEGSTSDFTKLSEEELIQEAKAVQEANLKASKPTNLPLDLPTSVLGIELQLAKWEVALRITQHLEGLKNADASRKEATELLSSIKGSVAPEIASLKKALESCQAVEAAASKLGEDPKDVAEVVVSDDTRKKLREARDAFAELDRAHKAGRAALEAPAPQAEAPKVEAGAAK